MRNVITFSRLGKMGRFANGAYQIAGTIGIARRNGLDPRFPLWCNHDGLNFENNLDVDVYKRFVNQLPIYDGPPLRHVGIGWGYQDVSVSDSVDLEGHFQSEKYFSHAIDEIRWYMRMVNEPPLNDCCAIHVRAGDYSTEAGYHPRLGTDYYRAAIAEFPADQKFLIFSDDLKAARYMFTESDKFTFSEGCDYIEDFKLLKRCSHFIIANSSYSAFAAVLGDAPDKKVVAPRPWFGPAAGITGEDIYNSNWTVINWQEAKAA